MVVALQGFLQATGLSNELIGLLNQVAAGDRRAFAALYDQTSGKLFAVIRRILPRAEIAEDALQETYVRVWQKAKSYDPSIAMPMAWLATIARNQAIDSRRRFAERMLGQADELGDEADALPDPLASAEQSDQLRALSKCLELLPEDRRSLVLLAYHQGYSREELAAKFKRPVTTIKTILRRSLIVLKECLDGR
jgi:RNA polymerase sigma-70 factor, ECF subfamily